METHNKTYVSGTTVKTLVDHQKEQNKIYSDFLDRQVKINQAVTTNIEQLSEIQQLLHDKFNEELENVSYTQDNIIEEYRKISYDFLSFKKNSIVNEIIDTVVIAALIASMLVAHFRIDSLEEKVAQYEQDKTIVLEDNSSELVDDKV